MTTKLRIISQVLLAVAMLVPSKKIHGMETLKRVLKDAIGTITIGPYCHYEPLEECIHDSAKNGNLDAVKWYAEKGIDINQASSDWKRTPAALCSREWPPTCCKMAYRKWRSHQCYGELRRI